MIASVENNVIITKDPQYRINKKGIGWECFNYMKKHKGRIAQVDSENRTEETFQCLLERCIRTAVKMRTLGVTKDDIIAICSCNSLDCCVPLVAALFLGAKVSCFNSKLNLSFITHVIQLTDPKLIFVDADAIETISKAIETAEVATRIVIFDYSKVVLSFNCFTVPMAGEKCFQPIEINSIEDTALIIYTHGSTGLPMGTCLSHKAILHQAMHFRKCGLHLNINLLFTALDRVCSTILFLASVMSGSKRIVAKELNTETFWDILSDLKVTLLFLTNAEALKIIRDGVPEDADTCRLMEMTISGGDIGKEKYYEAKYMFPSTKIFQLYTITEMAGPVTFFNLKDNYDKFVLHYYPSSVGKPMPGFAYKVVDPETGKNLGPYEKGELLLKSCTSMNGFFQTDSSHVIDDLGWLKTRDVVYYDEIYCFYYLRRLTNLIKFQEWFISPYLIEDVLMTHAAVKDAAVVGIPHAQDVNRPFALVVLKESPWEVSPMALIRYVGSRVHDSHRLRGGAKIVSSIPTMEDGEKDRDKMLSMVLNDNI